MCLINICDRKLNTTGLQYVRVYVFIYDYMHNGAYISIYPFIIIISTAHPHHPPRWKMLHSQCVFKLQKSPVRLLLFVLSIELYLVSNDRVYFYNKTATLQIHSTSRIILQKKKKKTPWLAYIYNTYKYEALFECAATCTQSN